MKDTNIVNIRFSRTELSNLDMLVEKNGFKSRSAYLKSLIEEKMDGIPNNETRAAVLEILKSDDEVRAVFQSIAQTAIQNVIGSLIQSSAK